MKNQGPKNVVAASSESLGTRNQVSSNNYGAANQQEYRVRQKQGLLECGWLGNNMGVIMYNFNLNISPKMSYGVLKCGIIVQNYMLMIL